MGWEDRREAMDAGRVLASLEALAKLYRSLHRLSVRQRRLIETGNHARLLHLLEAKQVLVDRLKAIQPDVERSVQAWRSAEDSVPPADRDRIRALLAEIDRNLNAVMSQDAEDSGRLACRRATVAVQLNEQSQTERATRAYRSAPAAAPGPRIDRKDRQG